MHTIIGLPTKSAMANGVMSTLAAMAETQPYNFEFRMWIPTHKPAFDMLAEMKPDYIFAQSDNIPNMTNALKEYPNTKVVLLDDVPSKIHANLWCVTNNVSDVVLENADADKVEKISPAANLARYNRGETRENYEIDVVYLATSSDISIGEMDVLSIFSGSKFKFRIIGAHRPFIQYVGNTNILETSHYLASSKIVLDFNENSLYDTATQGGFALSSKDNKYYPSLEIGEQIDAKSIQAKVKEWLDKPEDRKKMGKAAKRQVMIRDTYFHRVAQIFTSLEEETVAKNALEVLSELSEDM